MSEWVDIPLATQMGEGVSAYVSDMELVNLELKENPPGSRKPFHIASTPALVSTGITTPSTGKIRCFVYDADNKSIWAIQGTNAYIGSGTGGWTTANSGGTTVPGTGYVRGAETSTHMVFCTGANTRCASKTTIPNPLSTTATEDFVDVASQDGYAIYAQHKTQKMFVGALDDPTSVGALDYTTVDAFPGYLVGVISDHREVYAIKDTSIEHYYNSGGSGFPFVRSSPGVIERGAYGEGSSAIPSGGLTSVNTICKYGHTVFWLGNDWRVYAMQGLRPEPLSTPWVEKYLKDNVIDAGVTLLGSAFSLDGVLYYLLSEPFTSTVLVCDVKNRLWHRRSQPTQTGGGGLVITHALEFTNVSSDQHRAMAVAYNAFSGNSTVFKLDPTAANDTNASAQTTRTMTLPQFAPGEGRRTFMHEVYLDMEKASAATSVTLSWSDDGGVTYSSGIAGTANNARVRWLRLGSFYQRILRFTFSINSRLAILGVSARIEVGT